MTPTRGELLNYLHVCGIETFVTALLDQDERGARIRFQDRSEFELALHALRSHADIQTAEVSAEPDKPVIRVRFKAPYRRQDA